MLLNAENIYKRFASGEGYLQVLKGATLRLPAGKLAVLSGPSGSGKSTLLHILGGLDKPDEGKIVFKGEELSGYDDSKLDNFRNEKIGFVFQLHYLMPDFTALENVILPAMIGGIPRAEAVERASSLLSQLSVYDRRDHFPNQLSGGELQRVAVARALINDPQLILADEPTGNLDRQNGKALVELFGQLVRDSGLTVLIATHDPELAEVGEMSFRLVNGRIEGPNPLAD